MKTFVSFPTVCLFAARSRSTKGKVFFPNKSNCFWQFKWMFHIQTAHTHTITTCFVLFFIIGPFMSLLYLFQRPTQCSGLLWSSLFILSQTKKSLTAQNKLSNFHFTKCYFCMFPPRIQSSRFGNSIRKFPFTQNWSKTFIEMLFCVKEKQDFVLRNVCTQQIVLKETSFDNSFLRGDNGSQNRTRTES